MVVAWACEVEAQESLTQEEIRQVRQLERTRIEAIDKVIGSVVAIYGEDRQGGGSGVIIDPSGIALTNHHVIIGAGTQGWGGLADGKLYHWKLIGTDPGGDVALIQLTGLDRFPFAKLGDSDSVRMGDWALAMGNPFILTEDQKPTVTLGIVSGVKRYQPGAGANQLVYGNCIQVDSSINPGNSGGPLFNLDGEVIGINGRGSFKDRGRVNVGLGYAISSNQIKNFLPDLLATKLVEHGTLDASFSDRDGKVVCSTINEDAPIAQMGLKLGDELLEFEDISIQSANQYTNIVCTLPEDWPAKLKIKSSAGQIRTYHVRMFGLPYRVPKNRPRLPKGKKPSPEEKEKIERANEMFDLLRAVPGSIRNPAENEKYAQRIIESWQNKWVKDPKAPLPPTLHWVDSFADSIQNYWLHSDGRFRISIDSPNEKYEIEYDLVNYKKSTSQGSETLTKTQLKLNLYVLQAMSVYAASGHKPFSAFGTPQIDGSDKADFAPAYRLKFTDQDRDWFYAWLRLTNNNLELSKVSPDLNADQKTGGLLLRNWTNRGNWRFPEQRFHISGIGESPTHTIKLQKLELIPIQKTTSDSSDSQSSDSGSKKKSGEVK